MFLLAGNNIKVVVGQFTPLFLYLALLARS